MGREVAGDIAEVILSESEIREQIQKLGSQIASDYAGELPLLVCILKGGTMFLADLLRALPIAVEIDFMSVSSYHGETESSGVVRVLLDLEISIEGRHVLIVEDIIDTGRTLAYILELLETRDPASLKICTLMDKPAHREIAIPLDYVGFEIPDRFVVGYGLDYAEVYRNLPYVGVLKPALEPADEHSAAQERAEP
ncbi:MAG: hypoxanthine phosphoribosyltransferase [Anaerolineae bacterium]